jgi:hypothetical protein
METVKRVYAKPTILKVQLKHEQAVLAQCSTRAGRPATTGPECKSGGAGAECRKSPTGVGGHDSLGAS